MAEPVRQRVCMVQHLLAHYRAAVWLKLIEGRHEWTFLTGSDSVESSIKRWTPPAGTRLIRTQSWSLPGGAVLQPGVIRAALSSEFDVLVLPGSVWHPFLWVAALLGRLTGKRVYMWTHGWTRTERGATALARRLFYRLAHGLLLYGHHGKVWSLQQGARADRLHVIYNSLDYDAQRAERVRVSHDEIAALRMKVMGRSDRPIATCSTRLMPVRRLDLLIEAAAMLAAQGRPVDLLLIGDGPERAKLEALARERGVHCVFYGACYDEGVLSRLIMMSNCMVAPGKVGLTSLHALAYGTPVVTHGNEENQMPEWEAIIPGHTGSTFTDGDVGDLARAISVWTGNVWPREDVRAQCVRVIERFWNPNTQREIIERAIDGESADDLWFLRSDSPQARVARG